LTGWILAVAFAALALLLGLQTGHEFV